MKVSNDYIKYIELKGQVRRKEFEKKKGEVARVSREIATSKFCNEEMMSTYSTLVIGHLQLLSFTFNS